MKQHFLGLDAETIPTQCFQMAQLAVRTVADLNAWGMVYGDSGLGKTFAVAHAFDDCSLEKHWLRWPKTHSPKDVADLIAQELAGPVLDMPHRRLTRFLHDQLAYPKRLLVVDEAQELSLDCLNYLRELWDYPTASFALLFVGGEGCMKRLSVDPQAKKRLLHKVKFEPVPHAELVAALPTFHAIYAALKPDKLASLAASINTYCEGNWREWTKFTVVARQLMQANGLKLLTPAVVDATIRSLGSTDDRRPHGGGIDD